MKNIKIGSWYKKISNEICLVKVLGIEKEDNGEVNISFYDIEKDEYFNAYERYFKEEYTNKLDEDDIKRTKEINKRVEKDITVIKKSAQMILASEIDIKFKEFVKIRKELERQIGSLSLNTERQMKELKKKELLNDSINNYLDEQFENLDLMLDLIYGNTTNDDPRLKHLNLKKKAKEAIVICNQVDD